MAENTKEVTQVASSEVATPKKKKSNVLGIILAVILAICALVAVGTYWAFNKAKDVVENGIEEVETAVEDYDAAFEEIQEEIRDITKQAQDGEITQEEFQERLQELNEESLDLLRDSNE